MPDFVYMIETRLSPEQQAALKLVQKIARDRGMNVYLTGGTVREFFTGAQVRDLDFSVQGNALNLLKDLEKAGAQIQAANEHLQVLHVLLPGRVRAEIASTRTERYEKPSKPEVHPATMVEDLRRRDFTANAMALSLNPGSFALFMDPLNGVADIEAKVLRVVHNYGFYEEPSRMVRAARFLSRFGWTMEERTQTRYQTAKEGNYIDNIAKTALGYELEQVMHEPDPLAAMRALEAEGYLKLLYPGWNSAKVDEAGLQRVAEIRDKLAVLGLNADPSMAYAEYLTKKMPEKDVVAMQKMMPLKGFVEAWRKQEDEAKELAKRLTSKETERPSQTWKLLMSSKPETILYLALINKQPAVETQLENFFQNWPQFRQKMPYAIMTELRITPELPVYQPLLDEMFLLMIDGKLQTEEEIRAFLQPHSPPLPVAPPHMGRRGRGKKPVKAAKAAKVAKLTEPKAPDQQQPQTTIEAVASAAGKVVATVQKAVAAVAGLSAKSKAAPVKSIPAKAAAPGKTSAPVKAAEPAKKSGGKNIAAMLKRRPAAKKSKPAAKGKSPAARSKSKPVSAKPKAVAKPASKKTAAKKVTTRKVAPKKVAAKKTLSKSAAKSAAKKAPAKKTAKRR